MNPRPDKFGETPQYVVDRVTLAIKPMLDELKKDTSDIRQKMEVKIERDAMLHDDMMSQLKLIREQTTKTNGRVGELEKVEQWNKAIRYVLALATLATLSAVGAKLMHLID